jgi:subtilisin family serine protease
MSKLSTDPLPFVAALPADSSRTVPLAFGPAPLVRLLAEGDSWFAYPSAGPFSGPPNLISWLRRDHKLGIDNVSSNGDEVVAMLSGDAKFKLLERLAREPYDGLLFSGGGNDIVGRYDFAFFLRPKFGSTLSGTALIDEVRFGRRLQQIEAAYQDLIDLTGEFGSNRGLPIITHTYDLAYPSNQGTEILGWDLVDPWMKPYLELRGIHDEAEQIQIVHAMLSQFGALLRELERRNPSRLHVVNTQGTLGRQHWRDEIHASSAGYKLLAEKMRARLYQVFANKMGAAGVGMLPLMAGPVLVEEAPNAGLLTRLAAVEAQVDRLRGSPPARDSAPAYVRVASLGSGQPGLDEQQSGHHANWLSVRINPDSPSAGVAHVLGSMHAAQPMGMPLGVPLVATGAMDPIMALHALGLIKQIVPCSAGQLADPTLPMSTAMAFASTTAENALRRSANNHLIELTEPRAGEIKAELERDPRVSRVQRVPIRELILPAFAPPASAELVAPWQFAKIGWTRRSKTAVKVAVLDTGIDPDHPAFVGLRMKYIHEYGTFGSPGDRDVVGHGTHVAGTIFAKLASKRKDHHGLIDCELHAYKIFDDEPVLISRGQNAYYSVVVNPGYFTRALAQCLSDGIQVINLSIGGGVANEAEQDLLEDLQDAGIAIVAAMGNDNSAAPSYPAAYPGVIAVGASDEEDRRSTFSNRGPHISLIAPGGNILSTVPNYEGTSYWLADRTTAGWRRGAAQPRSRDYASWSGTSMATPHVTAAVALLKQRYPQLSLDDIRKKLQQACDPVPGMNTDAFTVEFGHGRLNWSKL